MIQIRTAQSLLTYFWPEFVELDGLVLLKSQVACATRSGPRGRSAAELESFCNHEHVLDHFRHAAWMTDAEGERAFDPAHPDMHAAEAVGRAVAGMWAAKLRADFPQYGFRVYCTMRDNPIVRFHRVRPGEPPWVSDEEVAADPHGCVLIEVGPAGAGAAA
jgi:hypothetical protein